MADDIHPIRPAGPSSPSFHLPGAQIGEAKSWGRFQHSPGSQDSTLPFFLDENGLDCFNQHAPVQSSGTPCPKPVNFLCPHQRRRKRRPNRIPMSRPSFPQTRAVIGGEQTAMPFCPRCLTQSPLFLARLDQPNPTLKWPFPRRKMDLVKRESSIFRSLRCIALVG